jgi:hypothetical protein
MLSARRSTYSARRGAQQLSLHDAFSQPEITPQHFTKHMPNGADQSRRWRRARSMKTIAHLIESFACGYVSET